MDKCRVVAFSDQKQWSSLTGFYAWPLWGVIDGKPIAANAAFFLNHPDVANTPADQPVVVKNVYHH